ncbi:catalase [Zalerion maritima]|uniref:Catalase n=1 Tax=Zalerion maritima TaxID=339359 RepID=A0AAD5WS38_9PEZI|nr:catalase [Zalerion maritima]
MKLPVAALTWAALSGLVLGACPYMDGSQSLKARDESGDTTDPTEYLEQHEVDDDDSFMTSDVGGPMEDQFSLKAGARGPTLLEDFIFRQKIQHFDHERVPERAVHARGAGAHGVFTSYADWSNITAASFLGAAGKETPIFLRFSTVAGSRGSPDTVRDVHGFALRLYTDEGNFDIVGNNIPVFFIQDAIRFPDLIHAVKPRPDNEIPQAATAHDSAWDYFSSQPSTMHTLFWAMAGYGIPRSFRHVDGFGVHTFRFVTDEGKSRLIKWHFKTQQGKASFVWEEAQVLAGKNVDAHRHDLFEAIENGNYPEWEVCVQIVEEEDALKYGFDLLDPTKIIPEEYAPLQPLGKFKLTQNPTNYFAETEQIMFQPGHIVRGVDFTEDPLLQGRIFSYLDTQLNRHGGPNFEQLPINMPRSSIHNNNRDGAGQMFIHKNIRHYSPSALSGGFPMQANQSSGRGFFTAPGRTTEGSLNRLLSATFDDHWSQPRLFYNSLTTVEQQFLINAMRFEASMIQSPKVRQNVVTQVNRISNDIACRLADALGLEHPEPEDTYYHDNTTEGLSILANKLPTAVGLKVGILATQSDLTEAASLKSAFEEKGILATVLGETQVDGIDSTYSGSDATLFDGLVMTAAAKNLLDAAKTASALFPYGRPGQIMLDGYRWGKPIGGTGAAGSAVASFVGASQNATGVFSSSDVSAFADAMEGGLKTFKFVDRFPLD